MLDHFRLVNQYLKHHRHSVNRNGHGVHSPFFYSFLTRVLPDSGHLSAFDPIEKYRRSLLNDQTDFARTDWGAGQTEPSTHITIRAMARRSLLQPRWCRLLHRMVRYYRPGTLLELGTSFGVTTQYLSLADPNQQAITVEGDPFIAMQARAQFQRGGFSQIDLVAGNFDECLPELLDRIGPLGFIWMDGNHREEPTIRYFEQIVPYVHNDTLMVLDDIYWSASMQSAWNKLRQHPRVRASIDLFRMGVLLFRKEFHQKSHIHVRY